eukprot:40896-Alexandrium_andersonii.AAC.1
MPSAWSFSEPSSHTLPHLFRRLTIWSNTGPGLKIQPRSPPPEAGRRRRCASRGASGARICI